MLISGQASKEPIWKIKWPSLHPSPQLVLAWRGSVLKHVTILLATWRKHHHFLFNPIIFVLFFFGLLQCHSSVPSGIWGCIQSFYLLIGIFSFFSLKRGLLVVQRLQSQNSFMCHLFLFWFTLEAFVFVSWTWFKRKGIYVQERKSNRKEIEWLPWHGAKNGTEKSNSCRFEPRSILNPIEPFLLR